MTLLGVLAVLVGVLAVLEVLEEDGWSQMAVVWTLLFISFAGQFVVIRLATRKSNRN
jgi:hypothetical protein